MLPEHGQNQSFDIAQLHTGFGEKFRRPQFQLSFALVSPKSRAE